MSEPEQHEGSTGRRKRSTVFNPDDRAGPVALRSVTGFDRSCRRQILQLLAPKAAGGFIPGARNLPILQPYPEQMGLRGTTEHLAIECCSNCTQCRTDVQGWRKTRRIVN